MKYFKVPNHVFDLNLTPIEFCVLCYLLKCRNSDYICNRCLNKLRNFSNNFPS